MNSSTLSNDPLADKRFDLQFVNPPYGYERSKDFDLRWQWSGATWTTKGCPQGERGGVHQFGVPPKGNAHFAWAQHFIHHLAPQGMAVPLCGIANGPAATGSSNQSGEGDIRRCVAK